MNDPEEIQKPPVELIFAPTKPEYQAATAIYEKIWREEGKRIIPKMEELTGLTFWETPIRVEVFNGISRSGLKVGDPVKLRHNYSNDDKKGTLIHELGHRIMVINIPPIQGYDHHQMLDLFLYDTWMDLYGQEFADKMVEIEGNRIGLYDYKGTWQWALAMTKEERQKLFREICQKSWEQNAK